MHAKKGAINKLIFSNTTYFNGKYRIYPTLIALKRLIVQIIEAKNTTAYIRFTPFYSNAKHERQIEFDEYMFYLECRDQFDIDSLSKHIADCFGKKYENLTDEEIRLGRILTPLCKNKDVIMYKELLENYMGFLDELIPKLMQLSITRMNLENDDIAFGYFCFEVHSG
jgi:hypothetical protein